MRDLTTSSGLLPMTEAAPATAPAAIVLYQGSLAFGWSPAMSFLISLKTRKRMPWLVPCFSTVAVRPL